MACELLAPAGNFETALAAFEAGADAVYCGLTEFSARAFAQNLTIDELSHLMRYARKRNRKVYVTFNTVIDEDSIDDAIEQLAELSRVRPDALIVQDIGVARICKKHFPNLELHASTQLVAHNLEGVLALGELGFTRVVLARELSLAEISSIVKRCGKIEIESFIHGALCYSISGLCLFGAMEKGRSGNRGKCPYCCRLPYESEEGGRKLLAFSMKDMRLGMDVRKLMDAGVASLKIEGRMKSSLYVASVARYYRDIMDSVARPTLSEKDLETVYSRRTTKLYFDGQPKESVIDTDSLGHLGTEIGEVKRVTRDRDGLAWLRFHTSRALEKHDGIQFEAMVDGRHLGMGIAEMRQAISRRLVFEVNAGADVELLLTEELASELKPGMKIYCSMSNAVKRKFPTPSFRLSDYQGREAIDLKVVLKSDGVSANGVTIEAKLDKAKSPEKTKDGIRKAFSKLGDTEYHLSSIEIEDADGLFVPMSILNELRRKLVESLDAERGKVNQGRLDTAKAEDCDGTDIALKPLRTIKLRAGMTVPKGEWDEVIVVMGEGGDRIATPVYTSELEFNRLRIAVKGMIRKGYKKWEASDLATLRMLKALGITDITADWTLYAFNSRALKTLSELGVRRFVAGAENCRENLQFLAESGYHIEFLKQQSTPLFISLTEPKIKPKELSIYNRDGLWVTTKAVPRTFDIPSGVSTRVDLSWDAPC